MNEFISEMQFVCIGYINEAAWNRLSDHEQSQILSEYYSYYKHLKSQKIFVTGFGFKSIEKAVKLSLDNNTVLETRLQPNKPQIGGIFVIETGSLQQATSIVSKHPGLKIGDFEIRIIDEEITKLVGAD